MVVIYLHKLLTSKKQSYILKIITWIKAMFTLALALCEWINDNLKGGFHVITFGVVYSYFIFILTHEIHVQICKQNAIDKRINGYFFREETIKFDTSTVAKLL